MKSNKFGKAQRALRKARGLTQEDYEDVSSRVYISLLERDQRAPTLSKVDELAAVASVHPMTLLALSYLPGYTPTQIKRLLAQVEAELLALDFSGSK